eukprot:6094490-Alexandrium_andersonii.AAC.1
MCDSRSAPGPALLDPGVTCSLVPSSNAVLLPWRSPGPGYKPKSARCLRSLRPKAPASVDSSPCCEPSVRSMLGVSAEVPSSQRGLRDVAVVVKLINATRFGHPDRYKDRCSCEILKAMKKCTPTRAVAISIATRYKSSPKGFAGKLVGTTPAEFKRLAREGVNGTAYIQSGITAEKLSNGVLAVAGKIAEEAPYDSWGHAEDRVKQLVLEVCGGTGPCHFAARQVAADLCRLKHFCGDLGVRLKPRECPLGPGAKKGWFFAEKAKVFSDPAYVPAPCPRTVGFQEQTCLCEYFKLVKRVNFPRLAKDPRHEYTPYCG